MKKNKKQPCFIGFVLLIKILIVTAVAAIILVSCSLPEQDHRTASIKIYTGGASGNKSSLFAGEPPSDIATYRITVTGADMEDISAEFPALTEIIMVEVPAGNGRQIELIANVSPLSPRTVISYKGSTTVDLEAGEIREVTISMSLNEIKLVIPDAENCRVVQIDNMDGDNWKEFNFATYYDPDYYYPFDVDFDNQGRIYVGLSIGEGGLLVRFDNISATSIPEEINSQDVKAITVDRVNNYIYYDEYEYIFRINLDNIAVVDKIFYISAEPEISYFSTYGITVDDEGFLYLVNYDDDTVYKYDPEADEESRVIASYSIGLYDPFDILYKDSYIYVSNTYGEDGYKIIVLDKDLNFVDSNGIGITEPSEIPMEFLGPKRFINTINSRITLIDDAYAYDRIVQFETLDGAGWDTYGQTGDLEGQFNFFVME